MDGRSARLQICLTSLWRVFPQFQNSLGFVQNISLNHGNNKGLHNIRDMVTI